MSLSEDIKKEWKKYLVGVIMLGLVGFGDKIIDIFNTGAEVEFSQKVEAVVIKSLQNEEIIKELLKNPKFVALILESDEVKKFEEEAGMRIRDEIVDQVTKSDTNKVSMRSFLGKEIGIRDEDVLPLLGELLKAYDKGEITTTEELEDKLRDYRKVAQF